VNNSEGQNVEEKEEQNRRWKGRRIKIIRAQEGIGNGMGERKKEYEKKRKRGKRKRESGDYEGR
jgi:hypothetical protein